MVNAVLMSVLLVFAVDERVSALPHVIQQVDAFCFQWTLWRASKRGFVTRLDQIRKDEPQQGQTIHRERFRAAVYDAVKVGSDIRVLSWWLNFYMPGAKQEQLGDIARYAICFKRLNVLQWLHDETQGQIPTSTHVAHCSDPEIAYWLHAHGRHLNVVLLMYPCSAADPSFEFAKWCLTRQDALVCSQPVEAVNFAINHGHEEYLHWLYEHRPDLFWPHHFYRAIFFCQLKIAKWLLRNFPKHFFIDPKRGFSRVIADIDADQVLKTIQFVLFEYGWRDESARLNWMDSAMASAAGTGKLGLLQAVNSIRMELTTNAVLMRLSLNMLEAAAANGHLAMVQWLHDRNSILPSTIEEQSEAQSECKAMDKAAANGHLDIVKWLHENNYKGCTTDAMDNAAENGHLDVIKWLHDNRSEGCTKKAMDLATNHGQLKVVQWLCENRTEGYAYNTVSEAARNGHFDVVAILFSQLYESWERRRTHVSLLCLQPLLIGVGSFELYEWLYEKLLNSSIDKDLSYTLLGMLRRPLRPWH